MKCPKCRKQEMELQTFEGVEIDRCPVCRGMYFDQGEVEEMLARQLGNKADNLAFTATSDLMDVVPAWCFRCDHDMEVLIGPAEIRIERCGKCGGVFLDQGELATLQLHAG